MNKIVFGLVLASFLIGCTSNSGTGRAREMNIRYGEIVRVSRVPIPSAAPAGAIVGGITGLVLARNSNPGRQAAAVIGGAAWADWPAPPWKATAEPINIASVSIMVRRQTTSLRTAVFEQEIAYL